VTVTGEKSKKQNGAEKPDSKAVVMKASRAAESATVSATVPDKAAVKKKTTRKKAATKKTRAKKPGVNAAGKKHLSPPPAEQSAPERKSSGNGPAWLALVLSMVALGLSGYAAYQISLNGQLNITRLSGFNERLSFLGTEQKGLLTEIASLKQASGAVDEAQKTDLEGMAKNLSTLQTTVAGIELASQATSDKIKADLGKNVARWKLDETQSLLAQVNQYYQLTGDKVRAERGLKLAQATLGSIDNPRLAPVKTALAEDLLRIQSDALVDVAALHSRLAALSALVPDLKLLGDRLTVADATEEGDDVVAPDNSSILAAGKSLLGDLGGLVKYRNLDEPLRPSLDGGERFVLYEMLQLKLQAAMIALLRHNNSVYQSQLKLAMDELNAYFDIEDGNARTFMDELKALAAENVEMNIEPVSAALLSLNSVMLLEN